MVEGPSVRACSTKTNNPIRRNRLLQKNFGINITVYNEMLSAQNNVCAICGGYEKHNAVLAVDHDHLTGAVRGLLCSSCNLLLGHAMDSIDTLERAIIYLKIHKPN